jgi:serine/threonine protein kinase
VRLDGEQKEEKAVARIHLKDLRVLGTLGKGSFGHVQLVMDTAGKTYALKAVNKLQIVQTKQQGHMISEKRVMEQLNHPFLVKLYTTFQDRDRIYFLLEPSLGGELFSVLRVRSLFDEPTSRFCAATIVLAFEYLHSKDIIYRDLKPENVLYDSRGYLKITDFGFAKYIGKELTWTLCGTPDYLAPEIVQGKGHGKAVDWWTLGIFIFEMLASYPPFFDEDPMQTYNKIMKGVVAYPSHFSKEAVDLLHGFLHPKPTQRLGATKGEAANIQSHSWFAGFDWAAMLAMRLQPPIVPIIKSETDLSNFDDYGDEEEPPLPYVSDGTNWDAEF